MPSIMSIMKEGIKPGGSDDESSRRHVNLSPYLHNDRRNLAAGRAKDDYDVVIVVDHAILRDLKMWWSPNGVILTREGIPPTFF